MEVESVLVTGANRGIGLEFVRQILQLSNTPRVLFATYRSRDTVQALEEIRETSKNTQVVLIQMDITNEKDIQNAKKIVEDKVGDRGLTFLINNAGALKYQGFPETTEDDLLFHFTTNVVGPVLVLKEMLPLLQKSAARNSTVMAVSRAAVLNISSVGGSITKVANLRKEWLAAISYRTSKAALNMAMRVVALTVKDQGILVVNMCPGWVQTDMGSERADLKVCESVSAMLKTASQLNESHHGAFLDRNGETIPF